MVGTFLQIRKPEAFQYQKMRSAFPAFSFCLQSFGFFWHTSPHGIGLQPSKALTVLLCMLAGLDIVQTPELWQISDVYQLVRWLSWLADSTQLSSACA